MTTELTKKELKAIASEVAEAYYTTQDKKMVREGWKVSMNEPDLVKASFTSVSGIVNAFKFNPEVFAHQVAITYYSTQQVKKGWVAMRKKGTDSVDIVEVRADMIGFHKVFLFRADTLTH